MSKVCTDLNKELETAVTCNGEYRFTFTDYDGNKCNVTVEKHDCLYSDVLKTSGKWYGIFFSRDDEMTTNLGGFRVHEKDSTKHIVDQMSQMILHWVSKTRIKKPKEKKCEFKYLDEYAAWDSKLEYDIESFIFDGYRHVVDNDCKPYFYEVGGKMFKLVQTPLFGDIFLSYYDTCHKQYIPIASVDGKKYDCFEINKLSKKLKEFFKDELKKAKDQN